MENSTADLLAFPRWVKGKKKTKTKKKESNPPSSIRRAGNPHGYRHRLLVFFLAGSSVRPVAGSGTWTSCRPSDSGNDDVSSRSSVWKRRRRRLPAAVSAGGGVGGRGQASVRGRAGVRVGCAGHADVSAPAGLVHDRLANQISRGVSRVDGRPDTVGVPGLPCPRTLLLPPVFGNAVWPWR